MELAARELSQPASTEMAVVVQETKLGMPLEASLERLRDRLPSREVAVLMTTLIIQQRAGGDTVRALSELGTTLEARKDLLREIRTMLSGAVFTSYLVAAMGAGTLVLVNAISPGVMRDLTTTLPGLIALTLSVSLYVIAFVIIKRHHEGGDMTVTPPRRVPRHAVACGRAAGDPAAARPRPDRPPESARRPTAGRSAARLRRLVEWLAGQLGPRAGAAHALLQARVDRPPAGPRGAPGQRHRAALRRLQGGAGRRHRRRRSCCSPSAARRRC